MNYLDGTTKLEYNHSELRKNILVFYISVRGLSNIKARDILRQSKKCLGTAELARDYHLIFIPTQENTKVELLSPKINTGKDILDEDDFLNKKDDEIFPRDPFNTEDISTSFLEDTKKFLTRI